MPLLGLEIMSPEKVVHIPYYSRSAGLILNNLQDYPFRSSNWIINGERPYNASLDYRIPSVNRKIADHVHNNHDQYSNPQDHLHRSDQRSFSEVLKRAQDKVYGDWKDDFT
ncbi:unnamed protein product [Kuraishia capsulata CBS 1993]|uniref:Uncharacterized protein n=1 Tax=Kuraishia capsulata CBS 1993 TaxID=1382522 RepID=W6MQV8_9ASCO|nr:uncharacterized protein KUCA_T00004727001 [Kuraishia capsulata CBS 1993]CDK28743.1 unnamed protein product [Kuraishia capsulata CBS 1993]